MSDSELNQVPEILGSSSDGTQYLLNSILFFSNGSVTSESQLNSQILPETKKGIIFYYAEEPGQITEEFLSTTVRAEGPCGHEQVLGEEI